MSGRALRVLFLCTGNSARSILAEALLDRLGEDRFDADSAGSRPTGAVNPLAIEQLREHGHPVERLRSKSLEEFGAPGAEPLDLVVTVCDDAATEACPVWPGGPPTVHWGLADPAAVTGSIEIRRAAFRRTYRELERRIGALAELDVAVMDAESLRAAVAEIAADDSTGSVPPEDGAEGAARGEGERRMNVFERYLSVWVFLCMLIGLALGRLFPGAVDALRRFEFGTDSQINLPIAVLIWLMIYPMMLKIDFASILGVRRRPRGILITLFVNWLVKPFSMALIAWLFFKHLWLPFIGEELANQYIAGCIILAAAPCTAMVFVWSYLTDGDPAYTLVQVSVNDLIMLVLFAPIVAFLVTGASDLTVPFPVLLYSVVAFIVVPLVLASASRVVLIRWSGADWFESRYLAIFHPVTVVALLATLILIFAFQAENIAGRWLHVVLIAIPLLIQVYFNSGLTYGLMRVFRVSHDVAAPGALIGASNFFELAVATAIALYGPESGAALATVVGVLVEVPVMLSVCSFCNHTRHWFPPAPSS